MSHPSKLPTQLNATAAAAAVSAVIAVVIAVAPTDADAAAVAAIAVAHTYPRAARTVSKLSRLYACHELATCY